VLLEGLAGPPELATSNAELIGNKILAALNQPYQLGTISYPSTPSIGIKLFTGANTQDEILRHADLAMYAAKAAGRNTLKLYAPEMDPS